MAIGNSAERPHTFYDGERANSEKPKMDGVFCRSRRSAGYHRSILLRVTGSRWERLKSVTINGALAIIAVLFSVSPSMSQSQTFVFALSDTESYRTSGVPLAPDEMIAFMPDKVLIKTLRFTRPCRNVGIVVAANAGWQVITSGLPGDLSAAAYYEVSGSRRVVGWKIEEDNSWMATAASQTKFRFGRSETRITIDVNSNMLVEYLSGSQVGPKLSEIQLNLSDKSAKMRLQKLPVSAFEGQIYGFKCQ